MPRRSPDPSPAIRALAERATVCVVAQNESLSRSYVVDLVDNVRSNRRSRPSSVSLVVDADGYFPMMSPFDNLHLGLPARRPLRDPKSSTLELAQDLGLDKQFWLPLDERERTIVCLARAISQDPMLLAVATRSDLLDRRATERFYEVIEQRRHDGSHSIFTTTMSGVRYEVADFLVVVRQSRLMFAGAPTAVSERRIRLLASPSVAEARAMVAQEARLATASAANLGEGAATLIGILRDVGGRSAGVLALENPEGAPVIETFGTERHQRELAQAAHAWLAVGGAPVAMTVGEVGECAIAELRGSTSTLGWIAMSESPRSSIAIPLHELASTIAQEIESLQGRWESARAARGITRAEALVSVVGGIAHDFNNSLQSVFGAMELIEARTTDPEIGGYAAVAKSVAQDAQLFVAKLLAFSRTSSTLKEPVDVHAVIADAVEVARRAPGHGVLIKLELNAQCSTLIGEAAELRNVFVNLLLNAFHAVDSARGVIVIRTRNCSGFGPGESAIEVDVEDNGSGIPRTIIERVFDPFVTSRTTRVGAGLGLVVARATIEDHRGSISVAKTSETGTIMRLLLPLECPCTPADVADSKAVTLPRPEPHPEGHQILLCDDDDRVRETLAAMMEALGHHVTQAECGMECIELFAEHPEEFDMVIVDQIMPDMLGDEVILHLYDLDPNAKIAWLSGYRAGADEEFIQPAVAARLSKPITLAELSNAIERVVATD